MTEQGEKVLVNYEHHDGYSGEESEFLRAMEEYRRTRGRRFPTFREVLAVLRSLGYRKVAPAGPLPRPCSGGGRGERIRKSYGKLEE
jgi:hypothetical protein